MKSLMLLILAFCTFSFAGTLQRNNEAQFALNKTCPECMQKYQLGTIVIKDQVRILKATYDFSVLGGAVGTVNLKGPDGKNVVLPNKALVVGCFIDVLTAGTTSASGTIAISTGQTAADIKAALAAASYTGIVACIPIGTAATAIKLTADRTMTATIATGAITAGKFNVIVQYVLSE